MKISVKFKVWKTNDSEEAKEDFKDFMSFVKFTEDSLELYVPPEITSIRCFKLSAKNSEMCIPDIQENVEKYETFEVEFRDKYTTFADLIEEMFKLRFLHLMFNLTILTEHGSRWEDEEGAKVVVVSKYRPAMRVYRFYASYDSFMWFKNALEFKVFHTLRHYLSQALDLNTASIESVPHKAMRVYEFVKLIDEYIGDVRTTPYLVHKIVYFEIYKAIQRWEYNQKYNPTQDPETVLFEELDWIVENYNVRAYIEKISAIKESINE